MPTPTARLRSRSRYAGYSTAAGISLPSLGQGQLLESVLSSSNACHTASRSCVFPSWMDSPF